MSWGARVVGAARGQGVGCESRPGQARQGGGWGAKASWGVRGTRRVRAQGEGGALGRVVDSGHKVRVWLVGEDWSMREGQGWAWVSRERHTQGNARPR